MKAKKACLYLNEGKEDMLTLKGRQRRHVNLTNVTSPFRKSKEWKWVINQTSHFVNPKSENEGCN